MIKVDKVGHLLNQLGFNTNRFEGKKLSNCLFVPCHIFLVGFLSIMKLLSQVSILFKCFEKVIYPNKIVFLHCMKKFLVNLVKYLIILFRNFNR